MASTPLTDAEIKAGLDKLKGWERVADTISKEFQLETYMAGLALATTIGTIAEGFNHHPDLFIGYRKVRVTFTTHDAGNKISQKDLDVAKAIDAVPYPRS